MKIIYRGLYCYIILLIIILPLALTLLNFLSSHFFGGFIFRELELSGVSETMKKPSMSLAAIRSGEFQSDFEQYFTYKIASRK
jgi:hypothetical protein